MTGEPRRNLCGVLHFNSHAHVERDNLMTALDVDLSNFNSHAHVERDRFVDRKSARTCHFNSHAHVERDVLIFAEYLKENISTHTLTWSVTRSSLAT